MSEFPAGLWEVAELTPEGCVRLSAPLDSHAALERAYAAALRRAFSPAFRGLLAEVWIQNHAGQIMQNSLVRLYPPAMREA